MTATSPTTTTSLAAAAASALTSPALAAPALAAPALAAPALAAVLPPLYTYIFMYAQDPDAFPVQLRRGGLDCDKDAFSLAQRLRAELRLPEKRLLFTSPEDVHDTILRLAPAMLDHLPYLTVSETTANPLDLMLIHTYYYLLCRLHSNEQMLRSPPQPHQKRQAECAQLANRLIKTLNLRCG